jgi:SAM-dependent methyltransferase
MSQKPFIPALGVDWLTGFYDIAIRVTMPERRFRGRLLDLVAPASGEQILEFGYGTGQNMVEALRRNASPVYSGLDIDPKVRAIAARKLEIWPVQLDLYDGGKFPYQAGQFDTVFSSLVFHQLDQPTKRHCLEEIHRTLKPGGKLVVGDWGKPQSSLMRIAFYAVQLLDGFATTQDSVKGLLPVLMRECGFVNVREVGALSTLVGSYCYYLAHKNK